ncbi:hypothetical protein PFUGPA_00428 [Plasmodium falciparum Palo Alto/Uganda]|nr:hypothetical protein PFFCH_05003 [Plasmodium falciparum FCH/4]ETW57524.1 hypothetical protein PFUGPA_00428 [Plasmodium falciparum Palo Alto/Uganda]
MVHDMPARLNLRKIIYKYLILELFTNAQSCNFLTCIEKGTTFLISHINKDMEKEIFQKKSRKYINLMKKVQIYHLNMIDNIYDLKAIQLYTNILINCLIQNTTSSNLSFKEQEMLLRSLLFFYFKKKFI